MNTVYFQGQELKKEMRQEKNKMRRNQSDLDWKITKFLSVISLNSWKILRKLQEATRKNHECIYQGSQIEILFFKKQYILC